MATTHHVGQRLSYDGALCTVRYVGEVAGTSATWLGVEWDDAGRGKHDGSHKGTRYFSCTYCFYFYSITINTSISATTIIATAM